MIKGTVDNIIIIMAMLTMVVKYDPVGKAIVISLVNPPLNDGKKINVNNSPMII